jgi:hypothetical protein
MLKYLIHSCFGSFFRLPINPVAQVDMLGQVYVDTTETVSLKYHLNIKNVFEYVWLFMIDSGGSITRVGTCC